MFRVVVRALVVLLMAMPAMAVDITLVRGTSYQTMVGWEVTIFIGDPKTDASQPFYVDEIIERVVTDVGINRVRLEVRSGAEHDIDNWTLWRTDVIDDDEWRAIRYATVNDNADPFDLDPDGFQWSAIDDRIPKVIVPMRAWLAQQGEELYINLCYVAFTDQIEVPGVYDHLPDTDEYAEFMLALFTHLDGTFGWVPDSVEVILEPNLALSGWEVDGVPVGEAMVDAGDLLAAGGWTPDFVATSASTAEIGVSHFDDMIGVTGVDTYLTEISYHRYDATPDITDVQAIGTRSTSNSVGAAMLEWWFGNATYHVLHEDLTDGMNTSWQQFTIKDHFDIDLGVPTVPVVTLAAETTFTRLYFKWVRTGAQRFEVTSSDGNFEPLGFENVDTRHTVVIKAAASGDLSIIGLPVGAYGIQYAVVGSEVTLSDQFVAGGGTVDVTMPGAGVITVYQKGVPSNYGAGFEGGGN